MSKARRKVGKSLKQRIIAELKAERDYEGPATTSIGRGFERGLDMAIQVVRNFRFPPTTRRPPHAK